MKGPGAGGWEKVLPYRDIKTGGEGGGGVEIFPIFDFFLLVILLIFIQLYINFVGNLAHQAILGSCNGRK